MHFKYIGILLLWATCTLANIYHPVLLGNITVPINITMHLYSNANHLVLDEEGGYVYIAARSTLTNDYDELCLMIISVDLDEGNFTYKTQHCIATLQREDLVLSLINPSPSVFALSIFYSTTNLTTIMAMDVDGNLLLLDHQPSEVNLQSINNPKQSLYGSIYTTPGGMSLNNNYPHVYYAFNNKSYLPPIPIPTTSDGIIMALAVVEDYVYSVGGNYSLCQYPFLSLQLNATTRCQSLTRYSEQLDPLNLNNSVFRFTAPPSGTKLVLSIFSVTDKKARYILWNTQDFEDTYLLNLNPDLTPWTLTSICVTYNAELMLSSYNDFWYNFALLDISSMTNGEVLSIPSTGSDYFYNPADLVISYDGSRLIALYLNIDPENPYLQLGSIDVSPTLTPTPQTYLSGLPYMQQIITDEVHGGFWCRQSAFPIVGFYSMDNDTLQLQWVPVNITQDLVVFIEVGSPNLKLQNDSKYMLLFNDGRITIANIHQNAANELNLSLSSSLIFSAYMDIRVAQFVEAETTNLILIMSQCTIITDNLWVTVLEATGEVIEDPIPLANISLEGTLQYSVQTSALSETNYIFDFLVSRADPTLLFAVAVGDMQNNTNLIEFEYDYSTRGMAITKNITVELNCRLLQSQTIRGYLWILCATSDDHFMLRQIFAPSYSTCCSLDLFNYNITYKGSIPYIIQWWINGNGTRLLIASGLNFAMYDISMCQCSNTSRQITPTVLYNYVADYITQRGGLYTLEKQYGVVVVGYALQGQLQLFTDCPSGRHPSELNYCSMCVPGQSGTFCSPCPAGYLCDRYGLSLPYNLCPAGHYCEPGSIQDPPPCDAGTYCPAGITTRNVTDAFNSAKSCAAGFYCPVASTTPTAFACPPFTLSKVAAGSISDCTCISGYYGFGGACILCPSECECSGPTISRCWMPPGFGISDLHSNSIKPLLCPSYSITGGNQCNPNGTAWNGDGDFPCELGYQDRMCGRCDIGYFADGRRCNLCEPYLGWLLPVLYVATAVFIGLYAWFDSSSDSAALKIILFHFQSLFALITSGLEWNSLILHFVRASSGASSLNYMATECIIPGWNLTWSLLFTLLTPLLALVLGCLAWCSSRIVAVLPMVKPLEPQVRKQRLMKVVIFVVTLTYFNIATACFSMFACTSYDSRTDVSYLNSYPWVRCSGKQFNIYLLLGVGGFLLEVIGLPVLYLLAVKSHRPRLSESGTMEVLGSLYAIYKPEHYYWECVVISRRLLIAIIITLVPFNSLWLYFGFFIVILGYATAHIIYNPYAHKMDNALDSTSQLVLLVSLFVGLLMGVNDLQPYNSNLSLILILLNVFFLLFGTFVIGRHYVRRFWGWWNDKGKRYFKTSMKCCTGGYTKIEPQDFSDDMAAKSLNSIYGQASDSD